MFAGQLLFIIFGWPKKQKWRENVLIGQCRHCGNVSGWSLVRRRRWLSLFFIPVFPLDRASFSLHCNVCMVGVDVKRGNVDALREFEDLTRRALGGGISTDHYIRERRALVNSAPELSQQRSGIVDAYGERDWTASADTVQQRVKLRRDLTSLPGVDEAGAKELRTAGYTSLEALAVADPTALANVEGLNEKLAERLRALARDELDVPEAASRRLRASEG